MRTAQEILEEARQLSPDERRWIALRLLDELDVAHSGEPRLPAEAPYARWLAAAGSVRSEFRDLSTDKYKHVAAASVVPDEDPEER